MSSDYLQRLKKKQEAKKGTVKAESAEAENQTEQENT